MFKQSCYIKKNTLDLRNKLEELGYEYGGKEITSRETKALYCHYDKYYECVQKPTRYHSIVNCEDNEELFIAIASLTDKTDKEQWFIYDSMDCKVEELRQKFWFKCEEDKVQDHMFYDCMYLNCKKATVKELIEHFKI
jgi:hypothetical protein